MAEKREKRDPYLWEALISIVGLIIFISLAIVRYETDAHVPILLGVLVAAIIGMRAGFSWKEIETGMLNGITNSLQAIVILAIIGIMIGVWILSGVVPTLLYYGLKILHPKIFLPAALIICSITSLATGSSWGTSGTIGIALIGIGGGLGFPLPLVAGAVLSGAYFGDKMSPLSDTTNMAPGMVGTDLYTHIKHMSYTTGHARDRIYYRLFLRRWPGQPGKCQSDSVRYRRPVQRQPLTAAAPGHRHGAGIQKNPGCSGYCDRYFGGWYFRCDFPGELFRQPVVRGLWRLLQQQRCRGGGQPADQRRF
jgi:hypothetical protein